MLTYWCAFVLSAWMAITHMRPLVPGGKSMRWGWSWQIAFFSLALIIGMRHEVGADWFSYIIHVENAAQEPLVEIISNVEPAYKLLNWLGANVGGGIYFVNSVCGMLFAFGLLAFCREQPRPWLTLLVAMPYLVIVVAMGYSRQGVAIGVAMLGFVALGHGHLLRYVFWVVLAAMFHKSAVILVPLGALVTTKQRWLTLIGLAVAMSLMFILLLQEAVNGLVHAFIEAEAESTGASIRIAMNALPAMVFLWRRKHFALTPEQLKFWTYMALTALIFIVLLVISPSSAAVDRAALYWIPLQLLVWSRLPDAVGKVGQRNAIWVYGIVVYSAAVLFAWLFFADNASSWLQYRWYPWIFLWQ